jgi:SNF2 family DNA or RNA helicase
VIRKGIKVLDFQMAGGNFIWKAKACIIGDEMGLGKTLQALYFADMCNMRSLVVCPAYLIDTWKAEVEKFLTRTNATIDFISYDMLKKQSMKFFEDYDFVIADEVQYLKSLKALRTQAFHQCFETATPDYFVGLSGTPVKNRVTEWYSPLLLISKHPSTSNGLRMSDYFKSEQAFCDYFSHYKELNLKVHVRTRGGTMLKDVKVKKYTGLKQGKVKALKKLLKGKYIRRKADKILDLPPLIEKVVQYPIAELKKLDERMQADFLYGASHLTTTKALSAKVKAYFTSKYVLDIIDQAGSVVVFTDHVESCEVLFTEIMKKHPVGIIQGSTPAKNRHQRVAELQAGKIKALVCTIGAAGVGFTMTKASNIVMNDVSWVPGDNWQAIKRIHRIGQGNPCCVHYIVGSEIDGQILKTLRSKERELREAL